MIRYALIDQFDRPIEVRLAASSPHQRVPVEYDGDPAAVRDAQWTLSSSPGFSGIIVGEVTSPVVLAEAMRSEGMKRFRPRLIEGQAVVRSDASAASTPDEDLQALRSDYREVPMVAATTSEKREILGRLERAVLIPDAPPDPDLKDLIRRAQVAWPPGERPMAISLLIEGATLIG